MSVYLCVSGAWWQIEETHWPRTLHTYFESITHRINHVNGHSWKRIIINFNEVSNSQIKSIDNLWIRIWASHGFAHKTNWNGFKLLTHTHREREKESCKWMHVSTFQYIVSMCLDIDYESWCYISNNATRKLFRCQSQFLLGKPKRSARADFSLGVCFFCHIWSFFWAVHSDVIAIRCLLPAAAADDDDDRLSNATTKINFNAWMCARLLKRTT